MTKKETKVMRGTFGRVWMNGELLANAKSFEAKLTLEYEEVDVAGELGKHQRLMGYTIEGTITLNKIDSKILNMYQVDLKKGIIPDVKIVSRVADPDSAGTERVELSEVTFDELMLSKYELKALIEEEVPFKAADYNFLDMAV